MLTDKLIWGKVKGKRAALSPKNRMEYSLQEFNFKSIHNQHKRKMSK